MAHDILFGQTSRDWSTGSLPKGATGYVPDDWWTEAKAEAEVQRHMSWSSSRARAWRSVDRPPIPGRGHLPCGD